MFWVKKEEFIKIISAVSTNALKKFEKESAIIENELKEKFDPKIFYIKYAIAETMVSKRGEHTVVIIPTKFILTYCTEYNSMPYTIGTSTWTTPLSVPQRNQLMVEAGYLKKKFVWKTTSKAKTITQDRIIYRCHI